MQKYLVSMPEPHTHYLHVELRTETAGADSIDLIMPVWAPGSYEVHDFAGRVHDETAVDGRGRTLAMTKMAKNHWRITLGKSGTVVFRYRLFAYDIDVDKSYLDPDRCTINGPGVFVYVDGRKEQPCELTVRPPRHWKTVTTGLDPVDPDLDGRTQYTFRSATYDELIDSPIFLGNDHIESFEVRGVPHKMVFNGPGNYVAATVAADTAKVVDKAVAVFGDIPYKRYVFFMDIVAEGGGGLEHHNSTHMIFPRFHWKARRDYLAAMGLISHEFFHTWNVKRLRPHGLGPFDYTREVHTPLLWFAEGFTSYYDNLLLRRAGVLTAREYLDELARELRRLRMTPGREHQTLEESSFDAWIKFYRRHPDSVNTTISYYNKGAIFAWMLDLELRAATKRRRSLDDLMRLLYQRFYVKQNIGVETKDIEAAASEIAGRSLKPLFDAVVRARGEPDYAHTLARCGLTLAAKHLRNDADTNGTPIGTPLSSGGKPASKTLGKSTAKTLLPKPFLGIRTRNDGNAILISEVHTNSPAQIAGLSAHDEVIGFNQYRVSGDSLEKRLAETVPGQSVPIVLCRSGIIRQISVTVGQRPPLDFALEPAEKADTEQKKLCRDWLGEDWDKLDRPKSGPDYRPREKLI